MKRTFSLLMALAMVMTMLVGTASAEAAELTYAEGTVLRMATGYNNTKTGLFFDAGVAGEGVTLADGQQLAPAEAEPAGNDPCTVRVTLHQGVYHQIKRMFGVYNAGVNTLHRLSIGGVQLDASLAPGAYRELTPEELKLLRR